MFLPQTFAAALFVLILGLLCLGSWGSAFKWAKLRYELSYFDFAAGVFILAVIFSLTIGNLGFDGFSLMDDLSHSGKRQWFYGFLAGVVFNLGNMLLMSAMSVSGLSVAFPLAFSMAMIVSTVVTMLGGPAPNMTFGISGILLLLAAIVVGAIAFNMVLVMRHEVTAKAGKVKSTKKPTAAKQVILALAAGLALGLYLPLIDSATIPEIGMGPFSLMLMFSMGMVGSTVILSIFFINLPVEGEPAELSGYLNVSIGMHFRAFLSGAIWCCGMLAIFVGANTADLLKGLPGVLSYGRNAAPLLAALWGLIAWKEFHDGDMRAKGMEILMLVLYAGGMIMLTLAMIHTALPT